MSSKRLTAVAGDVQIGGDSPIVVQTMCNTHTYDVEETVTQCIRMRDAGARLIRITVPGLNEIPHLQAIRDRLREAGVSTPLVADIHFSSETAIAAARIVEKVRINPGNFHKDHQQAREQFLRFLDVCKEYGLHPVIEIKPNADVETMDELAKLLLARKEKDMFVIISFGREICVRIKELMPDTPVYYLIGYEGVSREDIDFAVKNHLDGMDIHVYLPDDYVNAVKDAGLDIIVWTIDDMDNVERFYELGVNAITTNSITQVKPQGNIFQQFLWAMRDLFYNLKQSIAKLFG